MSKEIIIATECFVALEERFRLWEGGVRWWRCWEESAVFSHYLIVKQSMARGVINGTPLESPELITSKVYVLFSYATAICFPNKQLLVE